jgi:uncharacterized membrane protein
MQRLLLPFAFVGTCTAIAAAGGCTAAKDTESHPQPASSAVRTGAFPCDVNRVVASTCRKCHTRPPENGAPFPLDTYEDTQADLDGQPIYTYMKVALETSRMPLAPVELDQGGRAVLLAWLRAGAPPSTQSDACSALDAGADAPLEASEPTRDAGGETGSRGDGRADAADAEVGDADVVD